MNYAELTVLITGGGGGIGSAIAAELLARGASVLLVGRDARTLRDTNERLARHGERVGVFPADLTQADARVAVCRHAQGWRGGINCIVNAAGRSDFALFGELEPDCISEALAINVEAPIQLVHALLPHLQSRRNAYVVNIGSVFGAIGYPGNALYCASKFALRGFSEALRRELSGTSVRVHYLAPRATRTAFNSTSTDDMNRALGVATDPPERVAQALCAMLERNRPQAIVGWPEKLFARINALAPRLVDASIRKQLPVIRRYATDSHRTDVNRSSEPPFQTRRKAS